MKRLFRNRLSPLIAVILIVGVASSLVGASVVRSRAEAEAEEWLNERAEVVQTAIQNTVNDLTAGLAAVAAYMEVSAPVSQDEFTAYVRKIDPRVSLVGVAYVPEVPRDELTAFEERMRDVFPEYEVSEISVTGDPAPELGVRGVYYPVQYFVPGTFLASAAPDDMADLFSLGLGVDAGSQAEWLPSIEMAVAGTGPVVSDFIDVAFEQVVIGQAFFISVPVRLDGDGTKPTGVVAAPMVDVLLPTVLGVSITSEISWDIASTEAGFEDEAKGAWLGAVDLPGTSWALRVQPKRAGAIPTTGLPPWAVLLLGLTTTGVLATAIGMTIQRAQSRAKLAQLEQISEDKDRFLASVSHEIRTPLTVVAGLAHELRDRPGDFDVEESTSLLTMIAEQSDEVGAIVEDLLVAARSDIGKVSVHAGVIDVVREAERAMQTSGVTARFVSDANVKAFADAQRVRQILRNLLTNAGKYGGDQIEVRFHLNERMVEVTVADNGPPIPVEQQIRIFEPYTSAHTNAGSVGSIGLGLFISRKLAVLMGGDLGYAHDGQWSLFTLRLPKNTGRADVDRAIEESETAAA